MSKYSTLSTKENLLVILSHYLCIIYEISQCRTIIIISIYLITYISPPSNECVSRVRLDTIVNFIRRFAIVFYSA